MDVEQVYLAVEAKYTEFTKQTVNGWQEDRPYALLHKTETCGEVHAVVRYPRVYSILDIKKVGVALCPVCLDESVLAEKNACTISYLTHSLLSVMRPGRRGAALLGDLQLLRNRAQSIDAQHALTAAGVPESELATWVATIISFTYTRWNASITEELPQENQVVSGKYYGYGEMLRGGLPQYRGETPEVKLMRERRILYYGTPQTLSSSGVLVGGTFPDFTSSAKETVEETVMTFLMDGMQPKDALLSALALSK